MNEEPMKEEKKWHVYCEKYMLVGKCISIESQTIDYIDELNLQIVYRIF